MRIKERGFGMRDSGFGSGAGIARSSILNPESSKGFTLIELVVVVTIIAVLYTVFLERVWFYQERAEKTAMVEMEGALQSALILQYGRLMVRGTEAEVTALANDNPMKWLAKKPRNYAGEFYDPKPDTVAPGSWIFDLKAHELIYILNRSEYFIAGEDGKKWVRYRVNLMYDPVRGTRNKSDKELVGTLFEPVEPYKWFD
jgi:prepilin-type N-terminal cleavage/methylation domain-containing protein